MVTAPADLINRFPVNEDGATKFIIVESEKEEPAIAYVPFELSVTVLIVPAPVAAVVAVGPVAG